MSNREGAERRNKEDREKGEVVVGRSVYECVQGCGWDL